MGARGNWMSAAGGEAKSSGANVCWRSLGAEGNENSSEANFLVPSSSS